MLRLSLLSFIYHIKYAKCRRIAQGCYYLPIILVAREGNDPARKELLFRLFRANGTL